MTENRTNRGRRWAVLHSILIGVPVVAVAALALITVHNGVPAEAVAGARVILGSLTLIWLVMFVPVVANHLSVVSSGESGGHGVPFDLSEVDDMFGKECPVGLSAEQVRTFLGCVVAPKQFFETIAEKVESCHRSIVFTSALTLHLTGTQPPSPGGATRREESVSGLSADYVVPLSLPRKQASRHGIQVSDSAGHVVSTLSVHDLNLYTAAVLRYVIWIASPRALEAYLQGTISVESQVWKYLVKPDAKNADLTEVQGHVRRLPARTRGVELLNAVADAIGELSDRRPIAIAVPESVVTDCRWPSTLRYTVDRRFIAPSQPSPNAAAKRWKSLGDWARLMLGVSFDHSYVPLDAAYRTNNYNLEVIGPEGTYFAGGALHLPENVTFRATLQPRQGQRRAHLSLRQLTGQSGARGSEAFYLARFSERSPGSLAKASIAAAVSTLLICVLYKMSASIDANVLDHARTVALGLLAIPVAIATFVGLAAAGGRQHPGLISRFVTAVTAVLSLCVFYLLVVARESSTSAAGTVPPRTGEEDVWWNYLVWASVSVTAVSIVSWCVRLTVEHFARRGDCGTEGRDFSSSDVSLTH